MEMEMQPQSEPPQLELELVQALYRHIRDNNSDDAEAILVQHPSAWGAELTPLSETALHVAASLGRVDIVERLVGRLPQQSQHLETLDAEGNTPLIAAAVCCGDPRLARCMVEKNRYILGISNTVFLPVTFAVANGHREMARYLYSETHRLGFLNDINKGVQLLHACLRLGELGIALDLITKYPDLLLAQVDNGMILIAEIAALPSAYLKARDQLVFWKRWIYDCKKVPSTTNADPDHNRGIQQPRDSEVVTDIRVPSTPNANPDHSIHIQQPCDSEVVTGSCGLSRFIADNMLGLKEINEMKLVHAQVAELLSLLCNKIRFLGSNMIEERKAVFVGVLYAAIEGNVDFVVEVSKAYPLIVLSADDEGWNIFFHAVAYRQAEVFNLIHGLPFKDKMLSHIDANGNTMLHVVAKMDHPSKLNRISGPAFQMQSELQWFKEVEKIVPQGFRVYQNLDNMKPEDVFKENHRELRKDGEEWMKETASNCSIVAALVVTIMFAAAFTVPGGNDQNFGYPIFLKKKLFIIFIISDALSLFSSTTSGLIFLGILTSRYAEEDFLKSLPRKLIIGLSTLFLSIATMMIAFSATILLMLQHRFNSRVVYLPIIMLASVPVILFVFLQFPLLVRMISSTYGRGIFKRNVKPWLLK